MFFHAPGCIDRAETYSEIGYRQENRIRTGDYAVKVRNTLYLKTPP